MITAIDTMEMSHEILHALKDVGGETDNASILIINTIIKKHISTSKDNKHALLALLKACSDQFYTTGVSEQLLNAMENARTTLKSQGLIE